MRFFILLFFTLFFLTSSCSLEKKKLMFDEDLIQMISENKIYNKSSIQPPFYAFSMFFVQGDNGKIIKLDPREFEEIYIENYSSWNYKEFVKKSLNQQLVITNENKGQSFYLDKDIMNSYLCGNFTDFIKLYFVYDSIDKYMLKNGNLSENQIYSVFYYAFINNYLAFHDDYIGVYFISKTSIFTNKK